MSSNVRTSACVLSRSVQALVCYCSHVTVAQRARHAYALRACACNVGARSQRACRAVGATAHHYAGAAPSAVRFGLGVAGEVGSELGVVGSELGVEVAPSTAASVVVGAKRPGSYLCHTHAHSIWLN